MGKIATKKAAKQLQQLFDFLGEFGGVIETNPYSDENEYSQK